MIVLASQSPRRRDLMNTMGLKFVIKPAEIDESVYGELSAEEQVANLSRAKATHVAEGEKEDTVVIGADTVVALDNVVLGKPGTAEEAKSMLQLLSGKTHQVYTGITICSGEKIITKVEKTDVTFAVLSNEIIESYIHTEEPMDKAGAYGIQGYGGMLVEGICGDYSNVVGLPIRCLSQMLLQFGIDCMKEASKC